MKMRTIARSSIWRGTFHVPIVATNGVRFADPAERPLFDVLTCIRHKTESRLGRKKAGAQRRALSEASRGDGAAVSAIFPTRWPQPTRSPSGCSTRWPISAIAFRNIRCRPARPPTSFLRKLADLGARERYRPYHDRARAQIARELDLIERLDLAGYFLIVWDIVNFCRQHDILVQGRGSAANSAVCYSLGHHRRRSGRAWICCSSGFCRKSAANGPTSISICRAATGASGSSSTSTKSTAGWAPR